MRLGDSEHRPVRWLPVATTLAGVVCHLTASWAESYHARRLAQYDRLVAQAEPDDVHAFLNDDWLTAAMVAMAWGYPLAIVCFAFTAVLVFAG